jgi:hypothetical protein
MIQLTKKLWLKVENGAALVGIIKNGQFVYHTPSITWKDVCRGRKLAYERGFINSLGERWHAVYITTAGKAMMNLTK